MKKVVYSIKKVRNPNEKLSGFGFLNVSADKFSDARPLYVEIFIAVPFYRSRIIFTSKKANIRKTPLTLALPNIPFLQYTDDTLPSIIPPAGLFLYTYRNTCEH